MVSCFLLGIMKNDYRCLKIQRRFKLAQHDDPLGSPEECALHYIARSIRNSPDKTSIELHDFIKRKVAMTQTDLNSSIVCVTT